MIRACFSRWVQKRNTGAAQPDHVTKVRLLDFSCFTGISDEVAQTFHIHHKEGNPSATVKNFATVLTPFGLRC